MPELPEAETIARTLEAALCGRVFDRVRVLRREVIRGGGRSVNAALTGRTVRAVTREGKRVVVCFENGGQLVFALGMTGRLSIVPAAAPLLAHTHLGLSIREGNDELRFRDPRRFGGVWVVDGQNGCPRPNLLGPDALGIGLAAFRTLMARRRQVKALLLDQRVLAGLGNIYCDESLHRAGIHPRTRAADLTDEQVRRLWRQMRAVLRLAIRHGGSTFMDYRNADGRPGGFQYKHRVYDRRGEPCRACGALIERIVAAGRSTHLCPNCQRAGANETDRVSGSRASARRNPRARRGRAAGSPSAAETP